MNSFLYKLFKIKSKVEFGLMKGREVSESKMHGNSISYSSKDYNKTEEGSYKEGEKDGRKE